MAAEGGGDGEGLPPGEGVAPAGTASQPQGVAAVGGDGAEGEGVEWPPGEKGTPLRAAEEHGQRPHRTAQG